MPKISRAAAFSKLSPIAFKSLEGAAVQCKLRGNPMVELSHWLMQILSTADTDIHRIVRHYELDTAAIARELTASLDRLRRGATASPDID